MIRFYSLTWLSTPRTYDMHTQKHNVEVSGIKAVYSNFIQIAEDCLKTLHHYHYHYPNTICNVPRISRNESLLHFGSKSKARRKELRACNASRAKEKSPRGKCVRCTQTISITQRVERKKESMWWWKPYIVFETTYSIMEWKDFCCCTLTFINNYPAQAPQHHI